MAYKTIIFTLLLFFFQKVYSQKSDSSLILRKLQKDIDSIVNSAISKEAFPGAVVYASYQGKPLVYESYGYHTYDSLNPVYVSDIYDLASLTKVMASTLALMKLYDQGKVALDQPIKEYVNGMGWSKFGKVSIREALAHQGGIKSWIQYYNEIKRGNGTYKRNTISTEYSEKFPIQLTDNLFLHRDFYEKKIKKMIKRAPIEKQPHYVYSGLFFYLVPEMVRNLSGMGFEEYLETFFYDSLDMQTVCFNPASEFPLERIVPTEIDTFFRHEAIHGRVHDEGAIMMNGVSGNAGLFGDAIDVATLWQMLLADGNLDGYQYLSPSTVDLFTATQYGNLDNRRALGFDKPLLEYDSIRSSVGKSASVRSFGHTGYTGTLAWADPDYDLVFVFLSNRVYPDRTHRLLYELNIRPTIHQLIYDYLDAIREN